MTIEKIYGGLEITITDFFDTETFRNLEQEIKKLKPASERGLNHCAYFKISSFNSNTADATVQAGQSQFATP